MVITGPIAIAAAVGAAVGAAGTYGGKKVRTWWSERLARQAAEVYRAEGEKGLRLFLYNEGVKSQEHLDLLLEGLWPSIEKILEEAPKAKAKAKATKVKEAKEAKAKAKAKSESSAR